jgi:hypothetical protein
MLLIGFAGIGFACETARPINPKNVFRLSIKFYRLSWAQLSGDEPLNQRPGKTARCFTASPNHSDGTGHEPAVAEMSRPVTARAALSHLSLLAA